MAEASGLTGRPTHVRWVVIGLLFAIGFINHIDRTAMSFAIHDIAQQYHFDHRHVGLILGAFGGGYFVTTLVGGRPATTPHRFPEETR